MLVCQLFCVVDRGVTVLHCKNWWLLFCRMLQGGWGGDDEQICMFVLGNGGAGEEGWKGSTTVCARTRCFPACVLVRARECVCLRARMCMCVCVCVRERERERERTLW